MLRSYPIFSFKKSTIQMIPNDYSITKSLIQLTKILKIHRNLKVLRFLDEQKKSFCHFDKKLLRGMA